MGGLKIETDVLVMMQEADSHMSGASVMKIEDTCEGVIVYIRVFAIVHRQDTNMIWNATSSHGSEPCDFKNGGHAFRMIPPRMVLNPVLRTIVDIDLECYFLSWFITLCCEQWWT